MLFALLFTEARPLYVGDAETDDLWGPKIHGGAVDDLWDLPGYRPIQNIQTREGDLSVRQFLSQSGKKKPGEGIHWKKS